MKKKLLIAVLFTITLSLFAQSIPKASKLMVVNQKNENLSASEESWLPGAVRDRLEVNLQQYTDFLFVDSTNISAVKKIQKQSEASGYNESDAIELGKLTVAKYAVFLTLRKSGSGYTVVADVTDLTTGQKLASVMSSARKTADELFSTNGCAADDITVKLCEKLGITLSNTQKYALTHGDEILSNADQLKMAQEEEAAFKNAIAKYDAEIKRLSQSTDLESTASKAKMEADKALAQEKMRAAQERAKRLEEETKKAAADRAEDAARSEEQKRRRDQMAKEAAEKAAAVRKATLDNESIFTKINVIESKKKAIIDIQKSVDDRIAEIKKDSEDEFAKKKKEIMDAPYRAAEKNADGTPSTTAKERREKQVSELRKEIDSRVAKESEEVKNTALVNVNMLYDEIKKDQQNISQIKTVSSLEDDLKVQIGTFDGNTNAWNVKYWLYSNGVPVTNGNVNLAYTDLTGKKIDTSNDKAYDEFMDTVDLYNSLFSRGDPVLTFKVRYKPESVDDFTSQYKITLIGCDVFDTVSNRKICTLMFTNSTLLQQMKPVYELKGELLERNPSHLKAYNMFYFEQIGNYKVLSNYSGSVKGGKYVTFGTYPQTKKAADVTITNTSMDIIPGVTYYKGSDDMWYIKEQSEFFKVEPIKWRVLTDNYNGKKLLLAESILDTGYYDWSSSNHRVDGKNIRANNFKYSNIYAWLNGKLIAKNFITGKKDYRDYSGQGFLNIAFTKNQQKMITETVVDTNSDSIMYTVAKVFLPSKKEILEKNYGFSGNQYDIPRLKKTDYALIKTKIENEDREKAFVHSWWLRFDGENHSTDYAVHFVDAGGHLSWETVTDSRIGVVPALCVEY